MRAEREGNKIIFELFKFESSKHNRIKIINKSLAFIINLFATLFCQGPWAIKYKDDSGKSFWMIRKSAMDLIRYYNRDPDLKTIKHGKNLIAEIENIGRKRLKKESQASSKAREPYDIHKDERLKGDLLKEAEITVLTWYGIFKGEDLHRFAALWALHLPQSSEYRDIGPELKKMRGLPWGLRLNKDDKVNVQFINALFHGTKEEVQKFFRKGRVIDQI